MARAGSFSGSELVFGAPLLSVHPIDNRFTTKQKELTYEDDEERSRPGATFLAKKPRKGDAK